MIAYLLPVLYLLTPLIACALAIHWFERIIQQRLSTRFGWNSVLWTGWLGTPIHESSHALMCPIFRHRIDEIAFFEPDRKSGRLGYVRHSFHEGNWFEEMGNLFIGVAPLMGGSLVLLTLLYIFYPDAALAAFDGAPTTEAQTVTALERSWLTDSTNDPSSGVWQRLWEQTTTMIKRLISSADWTEPRWWIFLYLVLCVGSHMAPSKSDYAGSIKGGIIAMLIFAVAIALLYLLRVDPVSFSDGVASVGAPLLSVLALATGLCGLSTIVVIGLTSLLPQRDR